MGSKFNRDGAQESYKNTSCIYRRVDISRSTSPKPPHHAFRGSCCFSFCAFPRRPQHQEESSRRGLHFTSNTHYVQGQKQSDSRASLLTFTNHHSLIRKNRVRTVHVLSSLPEDCFYRVVFASSVARPHTKTKNQTENATSD